MNADVVPHRVKEAVTGVVLLTALIAVSVFVRAFRINSTAFDQTGSVLLLYHGSRLALVALVSIACYGAGYWIFRLSHIEPRKVFQRARATFIVCFFLGATCYGIVFTLLGLLGWLSIASGFALTAPILLCSYAALQDVVSRHPLRAVLAGLPARRSESILLFLLSCATVLAVLMFVLARVVFIANIDSNVWEHYLHYYQSVLDTGSTRPGEVWHHFYNSKGGGVAFLTNVLSDVFGVQLASACFLLVAGLVVFDLAMRWCRSRLWAMFAVLLYFTYLIGDLSAGTLFRVHGSILGYMAFVLWGSASLFDTPAERRPPLLATLIVCFFYLGFYQPIVSAILVGFLAILSVIHRFSRGEYFAGPTLVLGAALASGTILDFVVNWALTGLVEITPMRLFWSFADNARVEQVFGTGGVDFFLAVNNDFWSPDRWYQALQTRGYLILATIRWPLPRDTVWATAAALLLIAVHAVRRLDVRSALAPRDRLLVAIAGLLFSLCASELALPSPSIQRMGVFSILATTLTIVIVWKRIVDLFVPRHLALSVSALVIAGGSVLAFTTVPKNVRDQVSVIYGFGKGAMSLKDASMALERLAAARSGSPGTSITALEEVRRSADAQNRILSLVYEPGYAYFLGGSPVLSEPTYALVKNTRALVESEPGRVADYLRGLHIRYFTLNLQSRLFSTFAFTSLFDPAQMNERFSLVKESGDFFVLTWRQSREEHDLPEYLLVLIELKRSGIMQLPFDAVLRKTVVTQSDDVQSLRHFEEIRDTLRQELDALFETRMLPRVNLPGSRKRIRRIQIAADDALRDIEPAKVMSIRQALPGRVSTIAERVTKQELHNRLLDAVRETMFEQYVVEFGAGAAATLKNCDERVPFISVRRRASTCE